MIQKHVSQFFSFSRNFYSIFTNFISSDIKLECDYANAIMELKSEKISSVPGNKLPLKSKIE